MDDLVVITAMVGSEYRAGRRVADKQPTAFEDRWADAIGAPRPMPTSGQFALPLPAIGRR